MGLAAAWSVRHVLRNLELAVNAKAMDPTPNFVRNPANISQLATVVLGRGAGSPTGLRNCVPMWLCKWALGATNTAWHQRSLLQPAANIGQEARKIATMVSMMMIM